MTGSRLLQVFLEMVRIDSPSGEESALARYLMDKLRATGLEPRTDAAGNVLASLKGTGPKLLLCAHMDNVPPCRGIKAVVEGDWIRSDGSTILGADDKSGVSVLLEALEVLKEKDISHLPLEIAFTVREEVGLDGARALDTAAMGVAWGLVLDHGDPVETIVVAAPTQNSLDVVIHGRASHAGVSPELGISAIQAASQAIAALPLGRLDAETTANVGTIQGGAARNIVPDQVTVVAEARSHDEAKLAAQTAKIRSAFEAAAAKHGGTVEVNVQPSYSSFSISPDAPVLQKLNA
ncbi:MAG: M20/M25/M40 family metallo-hydrolase, partial [Dehalococcoidia bacterium]|nr:M20/M25/M40 family metallo-hydrolase [Dehalococcoidia bacterium]